MQPARVTVAICAYTEDRWPDLVAAVGSVRRQHRPPEQLLVVVDHNDDLAARARAELPGVEIVPSSHPRGLSGARNTAIDAATGDVLVFLDDDATADVTWLVRLLEPFADPDVLGVGGRAVPRWDTGRPRWFPDEFLWVVGCSHRGLPEERAAVRNLIGCNMAFRTGVLRSVGGFDVGLGRASGQLLGCEETELCIRARQQAPRGRFVLEPSALVRHRVPAERATIRYFLARCRAEGESKSSVAAQVGADEATSVERRYVSRTLPAGVVRGLADVMRGRTAGAGRALVIVAGLAWTTAGFVAHRLRGVRRLAAWSAGRTGGGPVVDAPPESWAHDAPLLPAIVDRAEPLPTLRAGATATGDPHRGAHCLVLDQGRPVGTLVVTFDGDEIGPAKLDEAIRRELGEPLPAPARSGGGERPDATVVVATRNRPTMLLRCLESILTADVRPAQLIVVDNGSDDDETAEAVRSLAHSNPIVSLVHEPRPGLATAHNAALPYVTSPVVAFTDDDVVVHRRWLGALVEGFSAAEDVVCVTGLITPLELDTSTQRWIEANAAFNKGYRRDVFHRSDTHRGPLFPYAAGTLGSGANMAFDTSYLREIGGFDDALGAGSTALGGDDLAAFYDVIVTGHRLVYEPAAIVAHQHHRDADALERQAYGYGAGLTAHLTRCVLERPASVVDFARASVDGIRRASAIAVPDRHQDGPAAPRSLARHQLRGMLAGPPRYVFGRRAARSHRSRAAEPTVRAG